MPQAAHKVCSRGDEGPRRLATSRATGQLTTAAAAQEAYQYKVGTRMALPAHR